jgi:hypothetical protein
MSHLKAVHWALCVALAATPTYAADGDTVSCSKVTNSPIFHASGYMIQGTVQGCAHRDASSALTSAELRDLTPPPNDIKPGEILMFSTGRSMAHRKDAFIRGKPNTTYFVDPSQATDISATYGAFGYTLVDQHVVNDIRQSARALPFYPTQVYDRGEYNGGHWYSYGKLALVKPHEADAYPLNENSMIVSIDGFIFTDPDTLAALLVAPGVSTYVDVVYYQTDDKNPILRRALVPILQRSDVDQDWTAITAANPLVPQALTKAESQIMAYAAMSVFVFAVVGFGQTEAGRKLYEELTKPPTP